MTVKYNTVSVNIELIVNTGTPGLNSPNIVAAAAAEVLYIPNPRNCPACITISFHYLLE